MAWKTTSFILIYIYILCDFVAEFPLILLIQICTFHPRLMSLPHLPFLWFKNITTYRVPSTSSVKSTVSFCCHLVVNKGSASYLRPNCLTTVWDPTSIGSVVQSNQSCTCGIMCYEISTESSPGKISLPIILKQNKGSHASADTDQAVQ